MLKRTIMLASMVAMGMIIILTFPINAWAFFSSVWQDRHGDLVGTVEVTSVIGYRGTSWNYVVNNIDYTYADSYADGQDYTGKRPMQNFNVLFHPHITAQVLVKAIQVPSPIWTQVGYTGFTSYVSWGTDGGGVGLFPGSNAVFSFQTEPVSIDLGEGYANGFGVWDIRGDLIVPSKVLPPGDAVLPPGDAQITAISGAVTITTATGTNPAAVGTTIVAHEEVKTGPNSSATIVFPDGSEILLQGDSMLSIGGKFGRSTLINEVGIIWNNIVGDNADDWNIATPAAASGVRGTKFWIDADELSTTVSVEEGAVQVADLSGGFLHSITDVAEGTSFTVNTVPGPPTLLLLGSGLLGLVGWRRFRKG